MIFFYPALTGLFSSWVVNYLIICHDDFKDITCNKKIEEVQI